MRSDDPTWRQDIGALVFRPEGHQGGCFVHRLAFRSLGQETFRESCEAFFRSHEDVFERAAQAKIQRAGVSSTENFHLTSRDIRRALGEASGPL
ncbi:hypothetical protein FS320_25640 [Microvirga tunisiensis]|uniref:DUF1488 domain-containing protein n=1 Tax=Microvirga tunisiensis TaxID=2108360 RepID=A0A5N7MPR3_9HYPH|nr:hypothetical protein [Microvirga tunisiensis]MPR28439.1 hypothetical protein [Microvirga tunisiensis]